MPALAPVHLSPASAPFGVRSRWKIRTLPREARGFTLIELSVVLAVIVTLALILTPAISNYVNDSRAARTRSDVQTIAAAIIQFQKDTGFFPLGSAARNGGPGTASDRVDLLVTSGNAPLSSTPTPWITGTSDMLADQLISNAPGYTLKAAGAAFGWNGPYLGSDVTSDAWGNRYMVNVGLLDATSGTQTAGGALKSAVWVISAGSNGGIDTAYQQPITTATVGLDDIAVRIQ